MATITATSMTGQGDRAVTWTTLTASDTFTYNSGRSPVLILRNDTGGALTVTIDGAGSTTKAVAGLGADVDVSGGFATAEIANGATRAIPLNTISAYLAGAIAVTGGTDIEAALLEF